MLNRREAWCIACRRKPRTKTKLIGRYIVSDPKVCHGQPTFRGTRILVADVLEQVASGMSWDAIRDEWRGNVRREAIAEAVRLARETFAAHADDLAREAVPTSTSVTSNYRS
jgi:uncharacterized protein (DUF433 family)